MSLDRWQHIAKLLVLLGVLSLAFPNHRAEMSKARPTEPCLQDVDELLPADALKNTACIVQNGERPSWPVLGIVLRHVSIFWQLLQLRVVELRCESSQCEH